MNDPWRPNAEFYEALIETSPLVVVRMAREDRAVRYISPNIARLFGLAAEAVTSPSFRWVDIVHPEDLDAARGRRSPRLLVLGHSRPAYQALRRAPVAKNSATSARSLVTGHGGSDSRNARP